VPRSFDVSIVGRWTDASGSPVQRAAGDEMRTPLAGARVELAIEDADGDRRVALEPIVPNRRYAIGKGEGCDVVVNGAFASRRHCEIWRENGTWWAGDAGSTNGVRVESAQGVLGRAGAQARGSAAAIEVPPGARIVLSAYADGKAGDYPRVVLQQPDTRATLPTPLAPAAKAPKTPVTPLAARDAVSLALVATMASGERTVPLRDADLPFGVGRSRSQALVVDWAHEGVSGQHVELVGRDDAGVEVRVHGDNGVSVDGVAHAQGATFRWRAGERMTLGRASASEPVCSLVFARRP
jgi:pSer/pThr/pTyr-binding forkhead associated (FHA) protein